MGFAILLAGEMKVTSSRSVWSQIKSNSVALISLTVALVSLAYNTWRNEQTEANRNVRVAAFQLMEDLVELQSVVLYSRFAQHDDDAKPGGPGDFRKGWVQVLAIKNLSYNMPEEVNEAVLALEKQWEDKFDTYSTNQQDYDSLDNAIERTKDEVLEAIMALD